MVHHEISFPDFEPSAALRQAIERQIEKLERFYNRIVSCHVVARAPHRQSRKKIYHIQVMVEVPGEDIIVNREKELNYAHSDPYMAVRDAFRAVIRQIKIKRKPRRQSHQALEEMLSIGKIVRFDPNAGYGFIQTATGRELYFHENSLVGAHKSHLDAGREVRFSDEVGEKGPQVTSMHLT